MDQKPFTELVKLVEDIVKSEYHRSPNRPIYLVGESIGACLALAVAARNPSIDFVLVLANPATSFSRSPIHVFSISQLQVMMASLLESLPMLDPSMFCDSVGVLVNQMEDGLGHSQAAKNLLQAFHTLSSSFSVIAEILPINALMWKMEMLKNGCAHANSYIHTVKAQTLILSSGRDPFLPSQEEGDRLRLVLPKCQVRKFNDNGHFLFLEDGVDLMYTIKVTDFYRRGRCHDIVADYLPPTSSEFRRLLNENWWYDHLASPVMLSTLENGKIVRGLGGVPSDGPTLFVGYHMLMGSELFPLSVKFIAEKNTVMRGLAHPLLFYRQGKLPDVSQYDWFRLLGAVPVSGANLFKLLATNSHVLLFPGGVRESLHRKGEEYKLFWPEQTEFVRMAARFGAKIVPFGVIGEDDIGELVVDYNDMVKIPFLKKQIEELTNEGIKLRTESIGEVSNQKLHIPGILPKVPGRFYYLFGRPIETKGRREELEDKEKGQELYLEVKYEVENCLAYLKEKREHDPYRNIIPRLLYQFIHKFDSEIPTFQI